MTRCDAFDTPYLAPCYPIVCDGCPFGELGDDVKDEKHIVRAIDIMKQAGITDGHLRRNVSFYVLAGYGSSTFEDALYRCERLKEMGTQAFVMPFHKKDKRINALARWANRPWLYWSIPFKDYKAPRTANH